MYPTSGSKVSRAALVTTLALLCLPGTSLRAQGDTLLPRITIRLGTDTLALRRDPALEPGGRLGLRTPPRLAVERWLAETLAQVAIARAARRRARLPDPGLVALAGAPTDTIADGPGPRAPAPLRALGEAADFGVDLRARFEVKFDRLRNERCTAFDLSDPLSSCRGRFPTPEFDQQIALRAGGVLSQRLHVNVDFDSEREFNANNNVNVFYQGLEDEILQRVELGNVTFRAPSSRFITSAIPANSFGVQVEAQVGAVELGTIVAQQKGSSLRSRVFTVGDQTTQSIDRELRDLDFETGRFFFTVDPRGLPGYPGIDILNLGVEALPPSSRPAEVRVYRLRAQFGPAGSNPNLGGIDAVAVRRDSPQRVGPFSWELLVESRDYYLDPSATWFALATRVGNNDFLAVSYITAAGDTVGTFPAINGSGDTLELVYEPRRGPEVPTFEYELRNVYRIGGRDVSRSSVKLTVLLNESERPLSGGGTYLSRLGLALSTDPSTLNEFNRVFPRERDPNGGAPVRDLFVVFPHLRPFDDGAVLLPAERIDSLYRTPTFLLRSQGPPPRFRLHLRYEASGAGDRTALNLGAIQIRDGSERLFLGNRELVRGRDYDISYDLGQVTFLNAGDLFTGPSQIRAEFEENQLFDIAPKSTLGLSATYTLGPDQRISGVALLQREQSVFTRPPLGFEPQSNLMAGITTDLVFRPTWLTRALDALPLISTSVPSQLSVNGEIAISRPNPNQAGQAYIEEFEGESGRTIPLIQNAFQLGSSPSSGRGLPLTHLSGTGGFAPGDAAALVWQNSVQTSAGVLEFQPQQIDSTIVLTGASRRIETTLWMTLKPDTVGGVPHPTSGRPRWIRPHTPGPRWRSITQPLDRSGLGVDLSRSEFIEFWVLEDANRSARRMGVTLILDFGTLFEDAVALAPDTLRVQGADTVFSGQSLVGAGRLDSEKDSLSNVFNAAVNDVGIHGDLLDSIVDGTTGRFVQGIATCQLRSSGLLPTFPLGDLSANCTRRNALADTEDLNGDNRLDRDVGTNAEDAVRYVFPVGDDRTFVRNGVSFPDSSGALLTWRLYRIPFRTDTIQIGTPNLRQVRALRITVAAPDQGPREEAVSFALARLRLLGAPWLKRSPTPIADISGIQGEAHGEVVASIVSTDNNDLGYTPPPGIVNEADRKGAEFDLASAEINERSLRLLASDLRVGERAEAFTRFVDEADKNFLRYGRLRVWARGRGVGWEERDLEFYVKVGRDAFNFYMYRTAARSTSWEPEVAVDLERWLELRAEIETAWLRGDPPSGASVCGGDSTAYVACDGPYIVHVRDPGTAPPNLARVSEVAVGMFRSRGTVAISQAELWVDDIRLTDVVADAGIAGAIDIRLSVADFADVTVTHLQKSDRFRRFGENPTFTTDAATSVRSTVRLDKLMPETWGLSAPLSVQHTRSSIDPLFISRGDVRGDAVSGLRKPEGSTTAVELSIRRTKRGGTLLERMLLDPLSVTARRQSGQAATELTTSGTTNRQLDVSYSNLAGSRSFRAVPQFLVNFVNSLPRWIRDSDFGRALRTSRIRWNPYQFRFSSTLTNNVTDRFTFRVPVEVPGDSVLKPLTSVVHTWRTSAGVELRPFNTLVARADYSTVRDLQRYGNSTAVGRLLRRERQSLLGRDVGFERARRLQTAVNIAPVIGGWIAPRFFFGSTFSLARDPNATSPVRVNGDSAGSFRVPDALANSRRRELGWTVDLGRLARGLTGRASGVAAVFGSLLPADFSFVRERRSGLDRAPFSPSLTYHLGLGDLEDFQRPDGILSTTAVETNTRNIGGGLQIPLGFRVRANYANLDANTWSRRGESLTQTRQMSREWPSGSVSWLYTPRWGLRKLLSSITAQAQYRRVEASNVQRSNLPVNGAGSGPNRAGAEVTTENRSSTVAPSVTIAWLGGVVTAGQYVRGKREAVTSGNVTRTDREDWTVNLSFPLRMPESFARLPNAVRSALSFSSADVLVCLVRAGTADCSPVSEARRRQFDARLDTGLSPTVTAGTSFSYVLTEQRHTSTRLSQIIFTIFAEINFLAGQIR